MDTEQKIAILVQTISHQGGRIDALACALATLLHIARNTPGLAEQMSKRLEDQYAALLRRSENADYVAGFDSVRDALSKVAQDSAATEPMSGSISDV